MSGCTCRPFIPVCTGSGSGMQNPLANFIGVFSLVRDVRGFQVNPYKIVNCKTYILTTRIAALCTYPEQPICTSLLFTLLFIKSQYTVFVSFRFLHIYCFAHIIVLHFLFHFTFYFYFSFFTIYMLLCCVTFISFFILLHCPLSGPDLMYISLLIIPCIIYYVTNKETLNLEIPMSS